MEWGISSIEKIRISDLDYRAKWSFIIEREIKTFHDKMKLKNNLVTLRTLEDTQWILYTERWSYKYGNK
jgi:hypothetical protein